MLLFFISTKFLPVVASILPLWIIAREFDLLNTRLVLIILYTAMNLPLAVWMLRSFFQEIPRELIEAAEIDGAGLRGQLSTVILPIAIPGIAATALLCVIFAWNEYFYAVQLNPVAGSTVPIWVTTNISTRGDFLAKLSAASVLASVPVVVGRLAGPEADDPRSRHGRHQVGDVVASVTFAAATRFYPGTDRAAVDSLDLQIADGELLVLVGPSGSGKSTALRMLAGLEPLDGGAVFIGDRDVTSVRPRDRDIAMVFQNYALYPQLTVAENMGFALKQKGVPKAERIIQVREAARILDLEPYLDRKPKNLSGGQRQRVAMGRAIVRHPQVYLMDEPLSNLDAKLRVQTRTELAELQSRLAVTTVYVTHDQVEAMTMGHRVAVLRDGVLQQCDTPHALYHAPGNLFVAGFIGSPAMNLVTCARAGTTVAIGGHRLELSPDAHAALDGFEGERVVHRLPARIGGHRRRDPGGDPRRRGPRLRGLRPCRGRPRGRDLVDRRQGCRPVPRHRRRVGGDPHRRRGARVRPRWHPAHDVATRRAVGAGMKDGAVVLITGAAGDIGRATAVVLADAGWRVALTDLPSASDALGRSADECAGHGADVWSETADVTDADAVVSLVRGCGDAFGTPAGLFANAGIQGRFERVDRYPIEDVRQLLDVNVVGVFTVLSAVSTAMIAAGERGSRGHLGVDGRCVPAPRTCRRTRPRRPR